jgi:hypothetical protein
MAVPSAIEIKLTEQFYKTRRNYLFWASLMIVVSLAGPSDLQIPGLGAKLPALLAYICVWLAMLYFGAEHYVEHSVAKVRNSTVLAPLTDKEVDGEIRQRLDALTAFTERLERVSKSLNPVDSETIMSRWVQLPPKFLDDLRGVAMNAVNEARNVYLNSIPGRIPGEGPVEIDARAVLAIGDSIEKSLNHPLHQWRESLTLHHMQMHNLKTLIAEQEADLLQAVQADAAAIEHMHTKLSKVSADLHTAQRVSFSAQRALCWAMFWIATFGAGARVWPLIGLPTLRTLGLC